MPTKPNSYKPQPLTRVHVHPERKRLQAFYNYRWLQFSRRYLRAHPLCVICKRRGLVVQAQAVDHKVPLAIDPTRQYDPTNLQALCKPCHTRKTVAENRR